MCEFWQDFSLRIFTSKYKTLFFEAPKPEIQWQFIYYSLNMHLNLNLKPIMIYHCFNHYFCYHLFIPAPSRPLSPSISASTGAPHPVQIQIFFKFESFFKIQSYFHLQAPLLSQHILYLFQINYFQEAVTFSFIVI